MFKQFDILNKDLCPICNSNYNSFSGKREDWHNEDCNCYLQNKLWQEYSVANLPLDYYSKDIYDYSFKDESKDSKYYLEILKYIEFLDKIYEYGSSLFLYSDISSTGKTFFATSILKEANKKGYSIYFLPFIHLYNELSNCNNDYLNILNKLNNFDFLVIDSVDKELNRGYLSDTKILNIFEEFLNVRFKPIIFTSQKELNSNIETLKLVKKSLKNRIYEVFIDNPIQYTPNDYWEKVIRFKKEKIK